MVGPEGAGGAVYCWLCARSTPASDRNFNVHCDLLEVGREPRLMSRRIDTRAVIPERPNYLVGACNILFPGTSPVKILPNQTFHFNSLVTADWSALTQQKSGSQGT